MPAWKVTFTFGPANAATATAGANAGWTETWYLPGDNTALVAANQARELSISRRQLLSRGWANLSIRMSILDAQNNPTRRGVLINLPPPSQPGTYPGENQDEPAYDALNMSVSATNGSRRAFLMRGVGSNVVGANGRFLNPPDFLARFVGGIAAGGGVVPAIQRVPTLTADLTGQGAGNLPWGIRYRSTTALTQISNVLTVAPANVNIITDATRPLLRVPVNTIQAGNTVSINGVVGLVSINGQWQARQVQVDPLNNQFAYVGLLPRRRISIVGEYEEGGVATYWNWGLSPVGVITPSRGASRRTGRPTGGTRGRRSNRRL